MLARLVVQEDEVSLNMSTGSGMHCEHINRREDLLWQYFGMAVLQLLK